MRDERWQMHYLVTARSGRWSGQTREISMKLGWQPRKWLDKKRKLGFRGYPVGTIAFYGPDAQRASKVAVAVIVAPDDRSFRPHKHAYDVLKADGALPEASTIKSPAVGASTRYPAAYQPRDQQKGSDARPDYRAPDRFDVIGHRRTHRRWRLDCSISLLDDVCFLEQDGRCHPL
jgi:hypothetical protein